MIAKIHRGAAQIGGNCIDLQSSQARILIDLGLPLDFDGKSQEEKEQIRKDAREWCKGADAIFISHAHADHFGLLTELDKEIPVFMSKETKLLIGNNPFSSVDLSKLNVITFPVRQEFGFKDFSITAYNVDHSAFGACAFLFEADGKSVLYSGDIRLHGIKGSLYWLLPKNPDYLFLEGTNAGIDEFCQKESELMECFKKEFGASHDSLNLVWCSSQNIDRIVTVYKACKYCGRQLVVNPYTAVILNCLADENHKIPNPKAFHDIKVYFPKRLMRALVKHNEAKYTYMLNPKKNKVTYKDIAANPGGYVLLVSESVLDFLKVVKSEVDSIKFTISNWHEYWNYPKIAAFRAWIEENCEMTEDIHTSGHADPTSLHCIANHVNPHTIIPIHTAAPSKYREALALECDILHLADNQEYTL